jgi:transposase
MVKQRQKFDKQFKMDTVRMIEESDRSVAEIAREMGIHSNVLYRWHHQYLSEADQAFPGKGRLKPAEEELRKLRRELEVVRQERDILKKALAVFSRHVD